MNRLAFILVDGLRDDTARRCMGYLLALQEAGRARWATLRCELPSLSRPLYATVIGGRRPVDHGVLGNEHVGVRLDDSVFDDVHARGGTSAAAAYDWFWELLCGERFAPARHRSAACPGRGVVAGRWYFEDDYPDSHLLADAEDLRRRRPVAMRHAHRAARNGGSRRRRDVVGPTPHDSVACASRAAAAPRMTSSVRTGRTSMLPMRAGGILPAIWIASLRSLASTR